MATKKPCSDLTKRSRSPVVLGAEMFSEFQDWCLRTYGDSGKTKTVTRRKYNKIMQTLLQNEESDGVYVDNSHINAKFKFWVKSKGFQVGSNILGEHNKKESSGKPVLYVPVKSTVKSFFPVDYILGKGVGVEEMFVSCSDGGADQDSSLKRVAVVEDFFDIIYAMHVEMGADPGRAPKHAGQKKTYKAIAETYAFLPREAVTRFLMSCGECQKRMHINPSTAEFKEYPELSDPPSHTHIQDESSVSSEDLVMAEPAWVSTERAPAAEPSSPTAPYTERMPTPPQPSIKEEEDDSSSENGSTANGLPALTPPSGAAMATGGVPASEGVVPYGEVNGNGATAPLDFSTNSSPSSSQEGQQPVNLSDRLLPGLTLGSYATDPNRKFPVKTEYGNKMFVRLFVDENLDRMVPISKQPKEKIQAIIESCSRQFPEFQERARKRIRTYLKSCRRMKKGGFETRPTPPHLTSAMAENILAAACESETRNAAKRMRLDICQAHDESAAADKSNSRDPAALAHSGFTLAATAYSQDQLYTNGGLNYSFRGYGTIGNSLQNNGTSQTNGPTDLSMKSLATNSTSSSSSNSHGQGGGGGGASAQLSPPEVTAVRQLIAGYRESAAFLLRSADELENLILQQN
ncbi:hypothetical protein cypCar_00006506 [Cyprinus carpio]|nr:hypothetical protein cypCar_00006506 [Cyprinus carpio]